jgi:hypothetical protein
MRWLPDRLPLWLPVLAAVTLLAGCQLREAPAPPAPPPPPSPSPTPVLPLRPPAQAILGTPELGAPEAATDGLTAAELAAAAPDQVVALEEFSGWGWSAASRRHWVRPGQTIDDLVLLTVREEGAQRAYAYFAAAAAHVPLSAGPCPLSITGLDACTLGAGGARQVVVGRLGAEVFVLDATGASTTLAASLAATQATRLRAT